MNRGRIVALDTVKNLLHVFSLGMYEVRVEGFLPLEEQRGIEAQWGAEIDQDATGATLRMVLSDACQLYLVIEILQRSKLPIVNVQRVEPGLGEIYMKFIQEESSDRTRFSS
jgi:hypothetical protein